VRFHGCASRGGRGNGQDGCHGSDAPLALLRENPWEQSGFAAEAREQILKVDELALDLDDHERTFRSLPPQDID
jgi:hypothetical protein